MPVPVVLLDILLGLQAAVHGEHACVVTDDIQLVRGDEGLAVLILPVAYLHHGCTAVHAQPTTHPNLFECFVGKAGEVCDLVDHRGTPVQRDNAGVGLVPDFTDRRIECSLVHGGTSDVIRATGADGGFDESLDLLVDAPIEALHSKVPQGGCALGETALHLVLELEDVETQGVPWNLHRFADHCAGLDVSTLGDEEDLQACLLFKDDSVIEPNTIDVDDLIVEGLELEAFEDGLRKDRCHLPAPCWVLPVSGGFFVDLLHQLCDCCALLGGTTVVVNDFLEHLCACRHLGHLLSKNYSVEGLQVVVHGGHPEESLSGSGRHCPVTRRVPTKKFTNIDCRGCRTETVNHSDGCSRVLVRQSRFRGVDIRITEPHLYTWSAEHLNHAPVRGSVQVLGKLARSPTERRGVEILRIMLVPQDATGICCRITTAADCSRGRLADAVSI